MFSSRIHMVNTAPSGEVMVLVGRVVNRRLNPGSHAAADLALGFRLGGQFGQRWIETEFAPNRLVQSLHAWVLHGIDLTVRVPSYPLAFPDEPSDE